ncbi:hypothetical protein AB3466_11155 [Sphingobacterium thalpophilum]|uniref:hypothetical protein n=1 Tax=Sphingobacterium thalpophilum TaxID=259 RepID=UPI0037DA2066
MRSKILLMLLLLVYSLGFGQEGTFKLYNTTFKASEILGAGKVFGPTQVESKYKTELF